MKIAVLGINYYPEVTGISIYSTQMCEYLAQKGHQVDVFTGFPYYPFGEDFSCWYTKEKISRFSLFSSKLVNKVRVKRANFYKPKEPNTIKRIWHESSFVFMLGLRVLFSFRKYDIIICISPPLLLGLVAYVFSRLTGTPFVFHAQDLQPDAAVELEMIKRNMFTGFLYKIERFIYRKSAFVLTLGEGMRQKILSKGISEHKVRIFSNWVDIREIAPLSRTNGFSTKHGLNDKFVILHAGNMGEKQDMRVILEAAQSMQGDKSVRFLLVGRGSKRKFVEDWIRAQGLDNLLLLDVQPNEVLNEMFSSCDISLITQGKKVKDIVMPSKVYGLAGAARPIIICAEEDCEISRLSKCHNFGMVVAPQDAAQLVGAINTLRFNASLARELGNNGRRFMENERSMQKIIDTFESQVLDPVSTAGG